VSATQRKAINRATANEFHDFNLRCLYGRGLTIQDVDAQAIVVNAQRDDFRVVALYELKRSSIDVHAWRPFDADRGTYAALLSLARAAGVPLFVIYYRKGIAIDDDTPLAVFRLDRAIPTYFGHRRVLTGREFAARFPLLTGPQEAS
jgi:hypothetical protein